MSCREQVAFGEMMSALY